MGFFSKLFDKKECSICGGEIGLLGNRKLEDGNMCKTCANKLSSWFDGRRHATVEQINAQLAYREENARQLESFRVDRTLGDYEKIHIEEVNGVPTRFFVTQYGETIESNPDIISFADVISCVTDLDEHKEELRQRNSDGQMVSYNPPRYKHHYNFIIRMEIRNNPYFSEIHFTVNSGVVTLESTEFARMGGLLGGLRNAALGAGPTNTSLSSSREMRRYREYEQMCEKIHQAVEDGKRGAAAPAPIAEPVRQTVREAPPVQEEAPKAKFCTGCGAKAEGGKFCEYCGTPL